MNINELTIGQAKELIQIFGCASQVPAIEFGKQFIGQKVIIRTNSAGVWFGTLIEKSGSEVILSEARRLWFWKAAKSISLSAVAEYGIVQRESKITAPVTKVWLEAIEILELSKTCIKSIEGAEIVEVN